MKRIPWKDTEDEKKKVWKTWQVKCKQEIKRAKKEMEEHLEKNTQSE